MGPDFHPHAHPEGNQFPVTHWTLIFQAARTTDDTRHRDALGKFCELYWGPLYNFVRRHGNKPDSAEDLTQGFFAHLLEKNSIASADSAKGSFRSFLLKCLKNFLINDSAKTRAAKRNPGNPMVSFDAAAAETRFNLEPVDYTDPEKLYERECALAVLERAISRLRASYEAAGKLILYEALKPNLIQEDARPFREIAEQLHTSECALRSETTRMRKELRKLLVEIIAPTASSPAEVNEEIQALFQALSR
jgi:RNA polymerase sigma-70 factor (ECF subfamily)